MKITREIVLTTKIWQFRMRFVLLTFCVENGNKYINLCFRGFKVMTTIKDGYIIKRN